MFMRYTRGPPYSEQIDKTTYRYMHVLELRQQVAACGWAYSWKSSRKNRVSIDYSVERNALRVHSAESIDL